MNRLLVILIVVTAISGCSSRKKESKETVEEAIIKQNLISIRDFGAIPNDNKDDSKAIQDAINFAIKNESSSHIYCPPGIYDLNSGIVVANQKQNGQYYFTTLTISGHISTYSSNQRIGSATVFRLKKPTFCIAFQLARNCVVENIVFEGNATYTGNKDNILNWTAADWGQKANARTDRYSPSCAVVIDPFHSKTPSGHRYPGYDSYYRNKGTGGSSMVLIRGCSFTKHYIAFANNPSGAVANGDNMRIEQSNVSLCHTFWSAGQTQSRANSISNVYAMFLHTFISGTQIGSQNGTPPLVQNINLAGFCRELVNTNTGFSGISFHQCYMEGVWSLGIAEGDYFSFNQCQIKFAIPEGKFFMPPFHLYTNNVATFTNCNIQFFDNCKSPMPLLFRSRSLNITGGAIQAGVIVADGYTNAGGDAMHNVDLNNVQIRCIGKVAGKPNSAVPKSNLKDQIIMGGSMLSANDGTIYLNNATTYHVYYTEDTKIDIDNQNKTASFKSSSPGLYQVGDNLFSNRYVKISDAGFNKPYKTRSPIGFIQKIVGNTITVAGVPKSFPSGKASIFCADYPQLVPKIIGSTSSGSNRITNVKFNEMTWQPNVGERVFSDNFPEGAYVEAIDRKNNTITMSTSSKARRAKAWNGPVKYQRGE